MKLMLILAHVAGVAVLQTKQHQLRLSQGASWLILT
jgi:hypothetical protein